MPIDEIPRDTFPFPSRATYVPAPLPNYFFIPSEHEPSEYIRANLSRQEERKAVCRCILPSWTRGTYSLRNSGFSFAPIYPSAASQICSSIRLITIEHSQRQNVTKERNTFSPTHIFVQIFLPILFLARRIHSKREFIKSCKTYRARFLHFLLFSFSLSFPYRLSQFYTFTSVSLTYVFFTSLSLLRCRLLRVVRYLYFNGNFLSFTRRTNK